jgi:hypothetical protein
VRRPIAAVCALAAVAVLLPSSVAAQETPLAAPLDTVSVSEIRDLSPSTLAAAQQAAADLGADHVVLHSGAMKMTRVWRGPAVVQAAPWRYAFPMWASAGDAAALGRLRGAAVGDALAAGLVVMGATTAGLRGAVAGDVVDLVGWHGRPVRLTVGLVADDALMGGAELLFSEALAASIGFVRPSRVVLFGLTDRATVDPALAANGLVRPDVRVRHSWDPPDPDAQISYAQTKALLGEFAYRSYGSRVLPHPGWTAANLPRTRQLLDATIPVRARCHVRIQAALQGALSEVAAAGLAPAIDVADTNRWGGCFNARLIRDLGRTIGGQLSRHSWGMAVDLNVRTNRMGDEPQLDCRVVRIFRKYGFVWGGNFLTPDGMHFEWVGERRDLLPYPSTRCPNEVPAAP